MTRSDALRSIIEEAAAARSALCENELVIRLDNILAIARAAPEEGEADGRPQSSQTIPNPCAHKKTAANPLD
ncbi:hypothetical protein [Azospirillum humicireducens]|nr:hypothetical protein [Azospirillum humicireducens]